jgi:hypothetical protein
VIHPSHPNLVPTLRHRNSSALTALLAVAVLACGNESEPPPPEPAPAGAEAPSAGPSPAQPGTAWERTLVLVATDGDSLVISPWSFRTERTGERELREQGVWLARGGRWEELAMEAAEAAAAPGQGRRILPGRQVRLGVGEGDALERLSLRNTPQLADLVPGQTLAEWTGQAGERVRISRGELRLAGEEDQDEYEGFLLDLSPPVRPQNEAPGDWVFLQAGNIFQAVFLETVPVSEPRSPATFRAWTRIAVQEALWPEVTLEWAEVRAFERARRDVPIRWRIAAADGEMTGELESVASHLAAGEGEGPLLPAYAFFQVAGEVEVDGETFQVTGVVRHRQR